MLPLTDLAEQIGLLDDGGAPLHSARLVGTQGGHWLALVCQATSEDECVFQGLTSPLTEVGGGWMSGIAQQGHTTASPVAHWPAIEDIVAQDRPLVGGFDQLFDGLPPVLKESGEPRLPFTCSILSASRAVVRGVPEHPPVPNRQHAKTQASPPRLAGNAWGHVPLLEDGYPTPTGVSAIARGLLAQQLFADHGMQPISAYQQVRLMLLPIGEVTDDVPLLWLEADAVRIHVDSPPGNLACQQPQQISTVDANAGGSHHPFDGVQSHPAQTLPSPGPALKVGEGSTDRGQGIGQTQLPQDLHPIGPQGQARSDLAQLGVALEDRDLNALALQGGGRGQSTNAATNDAHVERVLLHQLPLACLAQMHLVLTDVAKHQSPAPHLR